MFERNLIEKVSVAICKSLALTAFCASCACFAQESSEAKAKEVFNAAKDLAEHGCYKATSSEKGRVTTLYYKGLPEGGSLMRMEFAGGFTSVSNTEGRFTIIDGVAIRMDFEKSRGKFEELRDTQEKDALKNAKYSIAEEDLNGIPCYAVSASKPVDKAALEAQFAAMDEKIKDSLKKINFDFVDNFPAVEKLYVGKKDGFVYLTETYNKDGRLLGKMHYDSVELNPKLDDALFQIPKDMKVIVANTLEEYTKASSEILMAKHEKSAAAKAEAKKAKNEAGAKAQ